MTKMPMDGSDVDTEGSLTIRPYFRGSARLEGRLGPVSPSTPANLLWLSFGANHMLFRASDNILSDSFGYT
jgi:hypothetical protein